MRFLKSISGILVAAVLAWGLGEIVHRAPANQSNAWSPTTGTVSGLQLTGNYNNAFSALLSCNSGAAAPTNDQSGSSLAGQCWLDTSTTPYLTKRRYTGSAWVVEGWVDPTNGYWIPAIAGGINTVASATTTDLCGTGASATPNASLTITGNVTIQGFGANCPIGTIKFLTFSGTPLLVNNATSLILPNAGSNVQVAVGDTLIAQATGGIAGNNWTVVSYQTVSSTGAAIATGTEVAFAGTIAPSGWTMEYGQAISRTTSANLFNAITLTTTGQPANSSPTISNVSTNLVGMGVEGAFVEGTGVPIGDYISSVTSNTIVLNANATASPGTVTITILPWGQGDAATTFNVPDRRGVVIAGRDNMGGTGANRLTRPVTQGISGNQLGNGAAGGNIGGEQTHTQLLAEIATHSHSNTLSDPGHTHGIANGYVQNVAGVNALGGAAGLGVGTATNSNTTGITITNVNAGSSTAMNQVQPTGISNWIIKN